MSENNGNLFQDEAIEDLIFARQRIVDDGFLEAMTITQRKLLREELKLIWEHVVSRIGESEPNE